jgi:hypothetical protein
MPLMLVITEMIAEKALSTIPSKIAVEHIDASWVGMLVGGVTTGVAVAGLFLIVGWLLVKYGAVKVGGAVAIVPQPGGTEHFLIYPENCTACATEHERSKDNKDKIADLYSKWNTSKDSIAAMATDVAVIKTDVNTIKTGIKELQGRKRGASKED